MLKKLMLATVIVSVFATNMFAQDSGDNKDSKPDKMEYSIVGGVNFGYFNTVPPLMDAVSSFGYMIGVGGNLGTNLFFAPAIEFASYGSTITLNDANITDHKMRSNYIRVPVQLGLKLFEDGDLNAEIRAGVSESFLIGFTDDPSAGSPFMRNDISGMRT
ncbi:MAG TPA: outer membrane beta-barrel protein, partial [Candidatus Kapabacteria bacterium]|nr:outer membrane beta-barrel protein [Candidatus Kapabacteria bacterium]